jgi:hypothetical protein
MQKDHGLSLRITALLHINRMSAADFDLLLPVRLNHRVQPVLGLLKNIHDFGLSKPLPKNKKLRNLCLYV